MNTVSSQDIPTVLASMWERGSVRVVSIGSSAMSETWRVEFTDGELPTVAVLKRLPEFVPGTDILARVRLIEWLRDRGVSELRVLPTIYGTHSALMDDGRIYLLFEWVEGDEFNANHPNAFTEGGAYLGELHTALRHYDDPLFPQPDGGIAEHWRNEIARRAEQLVETDCPTAWLERLDNALRTLNPPTAGLPTGIVHGDYRAQNIRFRRARGRAILDWDSAFHGTRLADLAYALIFYASVYRGGPMSADQTRQIVDAYSEQVPLTVEERAALPAWLYLAFWRGISLWLSLYYERGLPSRVQSWVRLYADSTEWLDERVQQVRDWLRG
jgi:Ser/Thr protein kinase RdoA (MazF antagonist)